MPMGGAISEGLMLVILFIGYLALWRHKRRKMLVQNGCDPEVIYLDRRPTQKFFARLSRVMSIAAALLIVFHSAGARYHFGFYQFNLLDKDAVNIVGFLLGLIGLFLCWKAQQEMGDTWRVGIDRQIQTALVTTGVFKNMRNPTYSGLFLVCAGALMIFPTISFMGWVIVFYISIEFQVRIEEEYLAELHGEDYTRYFQSTKRYIPFLY